MSETKNYEYPEAKSVVVCGDIHGKFDELVYRITAMHGMTDTVVVVAGDCGFGFHRRGYYDEVQSRVLPKLEKARCWVAFVRGNHDNPAYFCGEKISHERWRCVSDYSTIEACGRSILCVGGATSVDRHNREDFGKERPLCYYTINDESKDEALRRLTEVKRTLALTPGDYWQTEQPRLDTDALKAILREGRSIDTVVTHVAPSMCEDVAQPAWLDYLTERDPSLPGDMKRDREVMDMLLERLRKHGHPLRDWLYGHYHHSWTASIDGIHYTMLRELEMKELR